MPLMQACPACHTRYVVQETAIGPAGRTERCDNCRHSWCQEPAAVPAAAVETPIAVSASTPAAEPAPIAQADVVEASTEPALPPPAFAAATEPAPRVTPEIGRAHV